MVRLWCAFLLLCSAGVLLGAPAGRSARRPAARSAQPFAPPESEVYRVRELQAACTYLLEQALGCKPIIWLRLEEGTLDQAAREKLFYLLPSYRIAELRVEVMGNLYKLVPQYKSCVRMLSYARGNVSLKLNPAEMRALQTAYAALREVGVQGKTHAEIARALHDWLVLNGEYDAENAKLHYKADHEGYNPFDGKYLLLDHKGVCDAYVQAYWLLLQLAGVPCSMMSGRLWEDDQGHAWNLVHMGDHWAHVDVTFDDPLPDRKGRVLYSYFDKTDEEMQQSRRWEQGLFPNAKGKGFMLRPVLHFAELSDLAAYLKQHPSVEIAVEVAALRGQKNLPSLVCQFLQEALPHRRISALQDPFYPYAVRLSMRLEAVDKPSNARERQHYAMLAER